ncbi:hypothetical protein Leryth_006426 [Lithospermum erythrorhizon]|nr:hypothetical protein Leryth_006426 [Lithospermum erythrorhizon]
MGTDVFLQLGILMFTLLIFYSLFSLPRKALSNFRRTTTSATQSHRHFIHAAQLLSKAKSTKSSSLNLLKSSLSEVDKAILINPKDPSSHILKALALEMMGHSTAALRSLDVALSVPVVKRLSGVEKADALIKRAELLVGLGKRRRVEAAVVDLVEAVGLSEEGSGSRAKGFCLLGQCYLIKGLKGEAKKAFEEALLIQPALVPAREGLKKVEL